MLVMLVEHIAVLADPSRQLILSSLLESEQSVGALCDATRITQPNVSKHLKVLREAGFVTRRTAAGYRIYSLEADRFRTLDAWLEPYRRLWTKHLDALEAHLDRETER